MKYLSVCSGIEAASVAWQSLGWQPVAFSEIDAFPAAVLAHRFPGVPKWGDMTRFQEWPDADVDVLVGGTPCQSFSVAGLRKGLADSRGNLMLTYLAIAERYRPDWLVWENVPGVLSSGGGRDFGALLGGLGELGYGWAYRVLDAQFFGVPQRRRRVFVVGSARGWAAAAAVLFEPESLRRDPPPRRSPREGTAAGAVRSTGGGSDVDHARAGHLTPEASSTLSDSGGNTRPGDTLQSTGTLIPAITVAGPGGEDLSHAVSARDGKGPCSNLAGGTLVAELIAFDEAQITSRTNRARAQPGDPAPTLASGGRPTIAFNARQDPDAWVKRAGPLDTDGGTQAVAFTASEQANSYAWERDHAPTITAQQPSDTSNIQTGVRIGLTVRRLTPRECERLQGFPDDWTLIPYRGSDAKDGPRYKALGNSMAVPCMRWIGTRIAAVEALLAEFAADESAA